MPQTKPKIAPETTGFRQFLPCNRQRQPLFAVQPGIPWLDAYNTLTILMEVIRELLYDANDDANVGYRHFAAYYLVEMADGLIGAWAEGEAASGDEQAATRGGLS
ncbi:MAG: DUF3077 domain-containing protein [Zoogloeaceae bacterium]|jgi:hypothetical protein|nr:DUF3077 domain-containing protein [Zoogloeaceae bacterium]